MIVAAAALRPGSNSQVEMDPRDGVGTASPRLCIDSTIELRVWRACPLAHDGGDSFTSHVHLKYEFIKSFCRYFRSICTLCWRNIFPSHFKPHKRFFYCKHRSTSTAKRDSNKFVSKRHFRESSESLHLSFDYVSACQKLHGRYLFSFQNIESASCHRPCSSHCKESSFYQINIAFFLAHLFPLYLHKEKARSHYNGRDDSDGLNPTRTIRRKQCFDQPKSGKHGGKAKHPGDEAIGRVVPLLAGPREEIVYPALNQFGHIVQLATPGCA
jgi:hypothetical protein